MGFFQSIFRTKATASTLPKPRPRSAVSERATSSTTGEFLGGTSCRQFYDALNESDARTPIPLPAVYALRQVVKGMNRERLALLAEYLYENDGLAGYAVDTIANYSVPICPISSAEDPEAAKAYNEYWCEWEKRADFTGRFNLETLQRIMCKKICTHGEIGAAITADNGFPQVQLVETHYITSRRVAQGDAMFNDGVAINKKGAVVGFYVEEDVDTPPTLVPASSMMLLYDADSSVKYRGYSPLRKGANDIRDRKDIQGFEKLATKISSALAAVLEGSDGEEEDVWGTDTASPDDSVTGNNPDPALDATTNTEHQKVITKAELLGGDIPVIPEGKKLHQLDNNRPGERVMDMLDYLGGQFCMALGLPPSFIVKVKSTGPGERSDNGKAQRKFDQTQVLMATFIQWLWVRVIAWGIENDGLPASDGWTNMEWQGPPKVSIDEGKDANSWREDFSKGLMTRQNHFGNRALSWSRETDQGFIEDDYILTKANALATKQNVPVEMILNRWGYASAKPPVLQTLTNETAP